MKVLVSTIRIGDQAWGYYMDHRRIKRNKRRARQGKNRWTTIATNFSFEVSPTPTGEVGK